MNTAIIEYLVTNKYEQSAIHFQRETGQQLQIPTDASKKDILEKKWTSLARLKKQIWDLERTIKQIKDSATCERCDALPEALGGGSGGSYKMGDGLPREPEKYTMAGHRAKVTKVAMHPIYNIVASASEDATIRLWDFEQGEHERTLKGHSGIVKFLAFH